MKKSIAIIIPVLVISMTLVSAQVPAKEKLDAYKIAFFTRRLNLTSQEAEKFWPVYNELQNRKNEIQQERASINRQVNQNELNLSEKQMIEIGDRLIALEVQEAGLAQEYHRKFREILSPVKVVRLYQAENQYRLLLLQELRQNQENRINMQQQRKGPGTGGMPINQDNGSMQ